MPNFVSLAFIKTEVGTFMQTDMAQTTGLVILSKKKLVYPNWKIVNGQRVSRVDINNNYNWENQISNITPIILLETYICITAQST